MEIVSLRLLLTEQDLNNLIIRFLKPPPKIRDLHVRIARSGLALAGTYETFLPIPFETIWRLFVSDGKIVARLSAVNAVRIPLHFLKPYILQALRSNSSQLDVNDESVVFDVGRLVSDCPVPIKTNLTAVYLDSQCLVLECQEDALAQST
jgi:hypothetical protein